MTRTALVLWSVVPTTAKLTTLVPTLFLIVAWRHLWSTVETTTWHQLVRTALKAPAPAISGAMAIVSGPTISVLPGRSAAPARPARWARATATAIPSARANSSVGRTTAEQTLMTTLVRPPTAVRKLREPAVLKTRFRNTFLTQIYDIVNF